MREARGFGATLWATPAQGLSPLARYTVANGIFYMLLGAVFYLLPTGLLAQVVLVDELAGHEAGLLRALGAAIMVVGWFYVMGGRTGASSFGLSTVVDRAIVPFVLVPLWLTGQVSAGMALPLAVLDPLLGLGAYLIWKRQVASGPLASP